MRHNIVHMTAMTVVQMRRVDTSNHGIFATYTVLLEELIKIPVIDNAFRKETQDMHPFAQHC